ncbi:type II toxin-antitoxin system ParD family antitoxin [Rhizobium panacihumi]|uniref:type II toxin-antitoxin system ParD family antitoxin n=1 Tax=Rhizobium panacihumi TaxID=2008450 RepID=UPI003D78F02D
MPTIALGNHYDEFIKKQLETGRYDDASEVIRAGLRLLENHEVERERWLTEEIPARYEELVKNPSIGVPAEDVRARFEAKRCGDARRGKDIDDAILRERDERT